MIRLLPLLIMACGSLASAQTVEENAAAIEANTANIQQNAQDIAAGDTMLGNRIDVEAVTRVEADTMLGGAIDTEAEARTSADYALQDEIQLSIALVHGEFAAADDWVRAEFSAANDSVRADFAAADTELGTRIDAIEANAGATPPADAPNPSLPYRIPPAFIVDGGWFEVRWICADTAPADCDLGMLGDGGDINVLRNVGQPVSVGGRKAMFVGGREADTPVNSYALSISATDPESYWLGASVNGGPLPEHVWLVHARGWLHIF